MMNETDKEKKKLKNKLKGGCPVPKHDPIPCLPGFKIEQIYLPDLRSTFLISQNIWNNFYGVVYRIIDTANGLVYIGQTIQTLKSRFYQHLYSPVNEFIAKSFDKYPYKLKIQKIPFSKTKLETRKGEFIIEIIQYCKNIEELNEAEKGQIKKHRSYVFEPGNHTIKNGEVIPLYGYNSDKGGGSYIRSQIVKVDKSILKNLTSRGLTISEIASEFKTSGRTIRLRLREFWSCNTHEARKRFGGLEKYEIRQKKYIKRGLRMMRIENIYMNFDKDFISELLEDELLPIEIEKEFFKKLIYDGYNSTEISNITQTYASNHYNELFRDNFENLRDLYFYKTRIIELLQQEFSLNEIYEFFDLNFRNKRGMGWRAILAAIKRIWNSWFSFFGHTTPLFSFLERVYKIFPGLNNSLITSLTTSNSPSDEIDRAFLIFLLHQNLSKEQIASSFNLSVTHIGRFFHGILGMNYRTAKREYYYKPHVIEFVEDGFTLTAMVKYLPFVTTFQHLQKLIGLIWKDEVHLKLPSESTFDYISRKYKDTNITIDKRLIKYVCAIYNEMRRSGDRFFDNQILSRILGYDSYSVSRYIKNKLIPFGLVSVHHTTNYNKEIFMLTEKGLELAKKLKCKQTQ